MNMKRRRKKEANMKYSLSKHRKKRSTREAVRKKNVSAVQKQPRKEKQQWKKFSLVCVAFLLCAIIILPTIIVKLHAQVEEEPKETSIVEVYEDVDEEDVTVTVQRTDTNEREQVLLEQYVTHVVLSEMPAEFEIEALKAQAVAARTYVINHLLHHEGNEAILDSVEHQVYQDEAELQQTLGADYYWKHEKAEKAVQATKGEIITYEDEPITPTFFSMSNGYTEAAENYWGNDLPYLQTVESKWEEAHPKFTNQTIIDMTDVAKALDITLNSSPNIPIKITRNESNRVSEVEIAGETFTGREVREKLHLRSSDFAIEQRDNHFIFTTKGYGHGVGMSQYGANGMAEEGKNYRDILTYYYQGVGISTIDKAAPAIVAND